MPSTIVLFEDVSPDDDLYFPITFRALVEYRSIGDWSVEAIEAQGAQGGWVDIDRKRGLWPVLNGYVQSQAGVQAIEDRIARESQHDDGWPKSGRPFRHAAE